MRLTFIVEDVTSVDVSSQEDIQSQFGSDAELVEMTISFTDEAKLQMVLVVENADIGLVTSACRNIVKQLEVLR